MVSLAPPSLSRFEFLDARCDERFAPEPVFRSDESRVGMGRGLGSPLSGQLGRRTGGGESLAGSSLITDSAARGSRRDDVKLAAAEAAVLAEPPTAPKLALLLSASFSRSLSLLLMYINPRGCRPDFLPQLSCECCFLSELLRSAPGDKASRVRSTLSLPMLSAPDANEPRLEGRESAPLLLLEIRLLRPDASRVPELFGDFGAVSEE